MVLDVPLEVGHRTSSRYQLNQLIYLYYTRPAIANHPTGEETWTTTERPCRWMPPTVSFATSCAPGSTRTSWASFAGQFDRGGPDDDDNWELRRAWEHKLGEGNWLGLSWPKRYGGREATLTQEILFAMEYAAAGAPPRAGFHGETLMAPTALHYGTEEQKARLLPPMARGEVVWCQGYSEPGAGSDLANISTRARLDGDDVGGQRPEGLDDVRPPRRLDVRDRADRAGLRPGTRGCPTC